jgi:PAS domain S-box-containing protein
MKLRTRYFLTIGLPLLLVLATTGLFLMLRLGAMVEQLERASTAIVARSMTEDLERRTENLAATAAHGLFNPVYHVDMQTIETIVRAFIERNRLDCLLVIDRGGLILHDGSADNRGYGAPAPAQFARSLPVTNEIFRSSDDGIVYATVPIRSGSDAIGWVILGLSLSHVDDAASHLRWALETTHTQVLSDSLLQVALIGIWTAGFGFLVAGFASRRLTSPIETMSRYAGALAQDFDASIARRESLPMLRRSDELGALARSFSTMLAALRHSTVSRRFLESVLNSIGDAVVVTDQAGLIQIANNAAARLAGRYVEDLRGKLLTDVMKLDGAPGISHDAGDAPASSSCECAIEIGGASIPALVSCAPVGQGTDRTGCVFVIRDISDWKRAERELIGAKTEAEHANRAKSEFLAHMSHELRTPLNAIIGFAEIMSKELLGPLQNRRYREYAGDVHASGKHLLEIVNDILDLAKLEAGKFELDEEPVDPAQLVDSAFRLLRERAHGSGVHLAAELPRVLPLLRVDRRLALQILINLATNAVKFSHRGGTVTVAARLDEKGAFEIAVIDAGIGIAEEDLPRVVLPFGQANSGVARAVEGTGLGLSLTKAMVERHGGVLQISSELGAGTRVTVTFPPERVMENRAPLAQAV